MPNYYPVAASRRWRGNKPKRRSQPDRSSDDGELFVVVDSTETVFNMTTTFMSIQDHWATVFERLSVADQISLCCVSKTVRDAAAKQLYRKFHIFFPDEDETDSESDSDEPYLDALAGGLNTFATSPYNYAQYVKEIVLETQCGGLKGERAYLDYHYDLSCGKFMNTLLHLTLLKAVALQTFRWDIRVELSREVYKTLHELDTLKHLHLRMHDGPSISRTASAASSIISPIPSSPGPAITIPYVPSSNPVPPGFMIVGKWGPKQSKIPKERSTRQQVLPTISGFKNLTSLAILDLDSVDYAEEIKQCLNNCSLDLRSLKLSFSDQLAGKARKPPPEPQPDEDSDLEDEFGQIQLIPPPGPPPGMPPPGAADPNGPIRELKAIEEKGRQDSFLAKVLGREKEEADAKKKAEQQEKETSQKVDDAEEMFTWLINLVRSTGLEAGRQKTLLQSMEKALKLYAEHSSEFESKDSKDTKTTKKASKPGSGEITVPTTGESWDIQAPAADDTEPSLFTDTKTTKIKPDLDISNPEDINVEEPEEDILTSDLPATEVSEDNVSEDGDDLKNRSETIEKREAAELPEAVVLPGPFEKSSVTQGESSKSGDIQDQLNPKENVAEIKDYIRSTRGLCLESLAICLIPVHGVALTKSIDLTVLTDITLLSVGQQGYFWILLAEENIKSGLPLRKIHTDDVSWSFLSLVNQLKQVDELLLLQRNTNKKGASRVENTNGQTNVKIKDIRRLVLKKHASTLKVLMIRNNNNPGGHNWDLDIDTTLLLCSRANKLEELSASFGTRVMHTLLQSMPNLASLRALHIIRFHCGDHTVTRELRKFAVENVANNPEMKLEYFALDNLLERIVRKKPEPQPPKDVKGKGKEKVVKKHKNDGKVVILTNGSWTVGNPSQVYPMGTPHHMAPTIPGGLDWGDDSDEEDTLKRSKVETISDMRFSNITDVRIFEKEVMLGRL